MYLDFKNQNCAAKILTWLYSIYNDHRDLFGIKGWDRRKVMQSSNRIKVTQIAELKLRNWELNCQLKISLLKVVLTLCFCLEH